MDLWMRNTQKQINNQPIYRLSKIFQQRNESRTHGTHFRALMDRNAFTFFFFFFLVLHWHDARS